MVLAALCLRWDGEDESLVALGGLCAVLGGIALLAALALQRIAIPPRQAAFAQAGAKSVRRANYGFLLPGMLAWVALVIINTNLLPIPALEDAPLESQFILLVVMLVSVTLGLGGFRLKRSDTALDLTQQPTREELAAERRTLILIAAITLLAFGLRSWGLGTEVHKFVDEVNFASAVRILQFHDQPLKLLAPFSVVTAFPWLYPLMQSWFVDLGGRNLESLRWLSVVLGTLSVPALYFMAKTLFNRKIALVAALLLATFPPHIEFSRLGLNNIADPLFGTLAVAFLVRGMKQGRRMDFALAGAALGLTQYFYEGGRFLYPMLILIWLTWMLLINRLFHPQADSLLRSVRQMDTFFVTAAVIGLPIYLTLISSNTAFDSRFQTVGLGGSYWFRAQSINTLQTFEQQILRPLMVYVHLPELGLYYGGQQAMLLPFLVVFFLLGLFWLLGHERAPGILLVLWLALTTLGNMLLTNGAIYARYVVVFPALILIVAVGLVEVPPMLISGAPRIVFRRWTTMGVIIGVMTLVFALAQVLYFFGPHLETFNQQLRPTYDSEDAIFRAASLPEGTIAQIVADNAPTEGYLSAMMGYLADNHEVRVATRSQISFEYLDSLPHSLGVAFFIQPDDTVTLDYLKRLFVPLNGPFRSPYPIDPARQLVLYYAPDMAHQ